MYLSKTSLSILTVAATVAVTAAQINSAHATNGYFSAGYGIAAKGMSGAGSALSEDTLRGAVNPAAMVHVGNRVDGGVAFFNPNRDVYSAGSTIPSGSYKSAQPWFIIPEFGVNKMLDDDSSVRFTVNANGGMNTEYGTNPFRNFGTNIDPVTPRTGVDLGQALFGVTYAKKVWRT